MAFAIFTCVCFFYLREIAAYESLVVDVTEWNNLRALQ
jgi:hypothetical protein